MKSQGISAYHHIFINAYCAKQFVVFPMFTPFCEVSIIVLLLLFLNMARTQDLAELLLTPAALEQGEEDASSLVSDTAAFLGLG